MTGDLTKRDAAIAPVPQLAENSEAGLPRT
jgi:hypothetical protein